jgi:NAD(P)-dependent dehydrogenase (short-subunit alcohol dehydrogenase family)
MESTYQSNPLQPNKTQLHYTTMPSTSPVVLILGAGPNIGQSVARAFAAKGYRVAVASRKATSTPGQLHIPSDFSNPSAVGTAFAKVKEALGIPSVVVYNGA